MTVATQRDMDPNSLDILRDGKHIGYIQWHPGREPRIELRENGYLTLNELSTVLDNYNTTLQALRPTPCKEISHELSDSGK